jgi:hypothetical protein
MAQHDSGMTVHSEFSRSQILDRVLYNSLGLKQTNQGYLQKEKKGLGYAGYILYLVGL